MTSASTPPAIDAPEEGAGRRGLNPGLLVVWALIAASGWILHATTIATEPRKTLSTLVLALATTTVLPVVMSALITIVALVPIVILSPLALVAAAQRRPLGLGEVYRGMAAPGFKLVPGYIAAWRRASSPVAIGLLAGSVVALPIVLVMASSRA